MAISDSNLIPAEAIVGAVDGARFEVGRDEGLEDLDDAVADEEIVGFDEGIDEGRCEGLLLRSMGELVFFALGTAEGWFELGASEGISVGKGKEGSFEGVATVDVGESVGMIVSSGSAAVLGEFEVATTLLAEGADVNSDGTSDGEAVELRIEGVVDGTLVGSSESVAEGEDVGDSVTKTVGVVVG